MQRIMATTFADSCSMTSASQTCVVRPTWRARAVHSSVPRCDAPTRLDFDSIVRKPLAVSGSKRLAELPNIPTVADTVPGYEATTWYGLLVPKGTPQPIIQTLNREIGKALAAPDVVEKLAMVGFQQHGSVFFLGLGHKRRPRMKGIQSLSQRHGAGIVSGRAGRRVSIVRRALRPGTIGGRVRYRLGQ